MHCNIDCQQCTSCNWVFTVELQKRETTIRLIVSVSLYCVCAWEYANERPSKVTAVIINSPVCVCTRMSECLSLTHRWPISSSSLVSHWSLINEFSRNVFLLLHHLSLISTVAVWEDKHIHKYCTYSFIEVMYHCVVTRKRTNKLFRRMNHGCDCLCERKREREEDESDTDVQLCARNDETVRGSNIHYEIAPSLSSLFPESSERYCSYLFILTFSSSLSRVIYWN